MEKKQSFLYSFLPLTGPCLSFFLFLYYFLITVPLYSGTHGSGCWRQPWHFRVSAICEITLMALTHTLSQTHTHISCGLFIGCYKFSWNELWDVCEKQDVCLKNERFLFYSLIPALLFFTAVLDSERGNVLSSLSLSTFPPFYQSTSSYLAGTKPYYTLHTHTHLRCMLSFMFHRRVCGCGVFVLYRFYFFYLSWRLAVLNSIRVSPPHTYTHTHSFIYCLVSKIFSIVLLGILPT